MGCACLIFSPSRSSCRTEISTMISGSAQSVVHSLSFGCSRGAGSPPSDPSCTPFSLHTRYRLRQGRALRDSRADLYPLPRHPQWGVRKPTRLVSERLLFRPSSGRRAVAGICRRIAWSVNSSLRRCTLRLDQIPSLLARSPSQAHLKLGQNIDQHLRRILLKS